VAAVEKYMSVLDLTSEELQAVRSGGVPSSQAIGIVQDNMGLNSGIGF
jgi:hypothetical protein